MATMNFSIPEDLKEEFNRTFAGENKSAVVASLMRKAIAERDTAERRAVAIDAINQYRKQQDPVSPGAVLRALRELRGDRRR